MLLEELLDTTKAADASDLHLVPGLPPTLRIAGELTPHGNAPLEAEALRQMLLPHLTEEELYRVSSGQGDVRKTVRHNNSRFLFHVFCSQGDLTASMRAVPTNTPTLEMLNLGSEKMPVFAGITTLLRGLVLVTGHMGSGKTTLCAAFIEEINRNRSERIITVEDPIEYEFHSKKSLVSQRGVGEDVPSFEYGLRSTFAEDPDVILISEARNLETMAIALSLAETGHLVFITMHMGSASQAVKRLIESYPEGQREEIRRTFASVLQAVVAQRLHPRASGKGRVPSHEVLLNTPRVRQMIAEGQTDLRVAIEAGRPQGMQTMDDSLVRLFEAGEISYETAWLHLEDKERIRRPEATNTKAE